MKFHINDQQQVRQCRAQKRCRFGGVGGFDHHFSSEQEAERYLVRQMGHDPDSSVGQSLSKSPSLASLSAKGMHMSKVDPFSDSSVSTFDTDASEVVVLEGKLDRTTLAKIKNGEYTFTL